METASLNALRRYNKDDSSKSLAVTSRSTSADLSGAHIILSTVERGTYFAESDTILVFTIFYKLFGEGTRLAMPKTICVPDSSSLKPGSGATEGVLD